jgi:hypothetical protein
VTIPSSFRFCFIDNGAWVDGPEMVEFRFLHTLNAVGDLLGRYHKRLPGKALLGGTCVGTLVGTWVGTLSNYQDRHLWEVPV